MGRKRKGWLKRHRFRIKIILTFTVLGLTILWGSYYFRISSEQEGATASLNTNTRRQAQSIADLISALHVDRITELKSRADEVNVRLIQNENTLLGENARYSGAIPDISIQNMNSQVFDSIRDVLVEGQDNIAFSEAFFISDEARNSVAPEFIYIIDKPQSAQNSHLARVLADSFRSDTHLNRTLWLGMYVRGSEGIAYDSILRGNIRSGAIPNIKERYFSGAPIYDENQVVIAALIFEYDTLNTTTQFQQNIRAITVWHIIASIGYFIAISVLVMLLCRPIKRLLLNSLQIQRNDFKSRAFVNSNDELELIGDGIDKIMEKLDSTIYDIESIKRGYNSLFPSAYLEFLDKSSIGELEIGEYVERYMNILSITVVCPDVLERSFFSSIDLIELVNDTVQYIGNVVDRNDGFIETFTSRELLLFFPHNTDVTLNTAKEIQARAPQWNAERSRNGKPAVSFHLALHRGTVSFSIVGEDELVKPYATSDATEITRKLSIIAKKIGSPIVLTDSFNKNVIKSLNYQFRYLGGVLLEGAKPIQILEEIDTYPDNIKKLIVATKIDFEEAVKSFERHYLKQAERIFDALIERNPHDTVAVSFKSHLKQQHDAVRQR